jgi:hypothetical protein
MSDLAAGLLAALGAEPLTTGELARTVGRRRADVLHALKELRSAGRVERRPAAAYHAPNRTVWQVAASGTARNRQGTAAGAAAGMAEASPTLEPAEAPGAFLLRGKELGRAEAAVMAGPSPGERRRLGLPANVRSTFLEALAEGWSVTHAAGLTGRHRRRFYDARARSPEFADQWNEAVERGTDLLEDELRRRAVEGWKVEVYQGGELAGYRQELEPRDLHFLLRARRPEVYRDNERRVELSSPGGQPLVVEHRETLTLREGLERIAARHRKEALESGLPPPELALPKADDTWPVFEAEPNGSGEADAC